MFVEIKHNDPVRLSIGETRRENARVKQWLDNGCLSLTFNGAIALRPGTKVQLEVPNTDPRAFYYMQAVECLDKEKTDLHLSRNTNSQFDQRRRGWRVPYSAKTVMRDVAGQQFVNAEFTNVSMEAAYLLVEMQYDVGTAVEMRLVLPEYPEHTISARVMRSSETALDRGASGKQRFGVLVRFDKLPKIVARHLTYFMWQQIRKTHLRQLQVVFSGTSRRPKKNAEEPQRTTAAVEDAPRPLE
jgi:hypothetical protein